MSSTGADFFVSYTGVDVAWAEWIAIELERAGYTTFSQVLDIRPGQDFVHEVNRAAATAPRTIAVLSPAYARSEFGEAEWRAAFAQDPSGEHGLLLPVRVAAGPAPGLLRSRVHIDLVGCDEATARARLLDGVGPPAPRPTTAVFPGGRVAASGAAFPGRAPEISNLPARNPAFTGRDGLLTKLRERLAEATVAAVLPVEAVHGLGGVGKTELVTEFAHRYGNDYDVVWWVDAEQPTTAAAALARLAERLAVPVVADQEAMINGLFDVLRRRERWLLIYDNAEQPHVLDGLLPPGGSGGVLVTSRRSSWGQRGAPLRVDVLDRAESVQLLSRRSGLADEASLRLLDEVAELVGDLPLALEEAAAYLEQTGTGIADYLGLLRERARELFGLDVSARAETGDERRVATVWSVSLDRVRDQAPAAEVVLTLCAFLGTEVPRALLIEHADALSWPWAEVLADRLAHDRALAALGAYSLVELSANAIGVHQLVQAVVRARLGPEGEAAAAAAAVSVVYRAFPDDSRKIIQQAECTRLMPHLLSVCEHAQRLEVAGTHVGWLLDSASAHLRRQGLYRQALPLAERALTVTEAAFGPDHAEAGVRRAHLGNALASVGDLAGARAHLEHALRISETALGPDHPNVGALHDSLGSVLRDLGDLTGARTHHERALRVDEAAPGLDPVAVSTAHNNLGNVLHLMGDLTGARTHLEHALRIEEAILGPDHPDIGRARGNLGIVLRSLGDQAGARTQLERALRIGVVALGPDHPDIGIWRVGLGQVLHDLGDLTGARTQLEHALRISESGLGPDHHEVAVMRNSLGLVLRDLSDLTGARAQFEHALRISEAALGPDHHSVGTWRGNLGLVLHDLGDPAGACAHYERALKISETTLGPDHWKVGIHHGNLGRALQALGDPAAARTRLERALRIIETALGPDHPDVAAWCSNLGSVQHELGDLTGARRRFGRAIRITEAAFGPVHPDIGIWCNNLGSVLYSLRDLTGARTQLERAVRIGETALAADHPSVAMWRYNCGHVLFALGDLTGARTQLEHATRISDAALGPDHPQSTAIRAALGHLLTQIDDRVG